MCLRQASSEAGLRGSDRSLTPGLSDLGRRTSRTKDVLQRVPSKQDRADLSCLEAFIHGPSSALAPDLNRSKPLFATHPSSTFHTVFRRVGGGAPSCPDASHRPPLKRGVRFSRATLSRIRPLLRCNRGNQFDQSLKGTPRLVSGRTRSLKRWMDLDRLFLAVRKLGCSVSSCRETRVSPLWHFPKRVPNTSRRDGVYNRPMFRVWGSR